MPAPEGYSSDWNNDGGRERDSAWQLELGRKVHKGATLALRVVNLEQAVARTPTQRNRVEEAILGKSSTANIIAWGVAHEVATEGALPVVKFMDVRQKQTDSVWSSPRDLRVAVDGGAQWGAIEGDAEAVERPAALSDAEASTLYKLVNVLIGEHLRQQ